MSRMTSGRVSTSRSFVAFQVVLVGSSDGLFHLGSALSFVQVLPPGVYVAMNGQYFAWDR
jgi:hypothetical protein